MVTCTHNLQRPNIGHRGMNTMHVQQQTAQAAKFAKSGNFGQSNLALTLLTFILAATLAACGGSSGGSALTPPVIPPVVPPVVIPPVVTPTGQVTAVTDCTVTDGADTCTSTLSFSTTNAVTPSLKLGNTVVSTSKVATNLSVTVGLGSFPLTLSDGTKVLDGSKSITGACGTKSRVATPSGLCQPIVCTLPLVWQDGVKACVSPFDVDLTDFKEAPYETGTLIDPMIGGDAWNAGVKSGAIQFFKTGMIITGSTVFLPKPLIGAVFIEPQEKFVCVALMYEENGLNINPNARTYAGCKTEPFDKIRGIADGYVIHSSVTNRCFKYSWDTSVSPPVAKAEQVTCP
jgi:hypothetical protein